MKINKLLFLLAVILLLSRTAYSQKMTRDDSLARHKAEATINNNLKITDDENYLLFADADVFYVIVIQEKGGFHEYFINADTSKYNSQIAIKQEIVKRSPILKKAFNEKLYHKEYINFSSPFFERYYQLAEGNVTYFYLKKNGIKYGEARLAMSTKPNPIQLKIYNYLIGEIFRFHH